MSVILTRYLYVLDESLYSLQESIIDGNSFEECVFWSSEIYHSGHSFKLWDFIFEMYYNFCAITHPKYEKKLSKFFNIYKTNKSIEYILSAVTLLFYTKKNYDVFTQWSKNPSIPNKTYIGRNPKWLNALNLKPKWKNLLCSIHQENWHNVIFYIKYYPAQDTYRIVKSYFEYVYKLNIKERKLEDIPYKNKAHIVFTLINYLLMDENGIQKKAIFRSYDHSKYEAFINETCDLVSPAYKTLPQKLQYPISNNIGCFPLSRYTLENDTINKVYWYHWEYHCYKSPLWKQRFNKYKITVNHDDKTISFLDDDEYESFCDKFYYENDEQTKDVQLKNIRDIPKISIETWIKQKIDL